MSDSTAAGVAKARHMESLAPEDTRIIDDPYAQYFYFGASLVNLLGHSAGKWMFDLIMPGAHEMLIARTRCIDDLVLQEVKDGVTQVVVLGAGYDMRSVRLGLEAKVKFFEVDQPAVQSRKREKMAGIPNLSTEHVHFVPVDFACQKVDEELQKVSDYDPKAKSLIILEGVSQYIPRDAVSTTVKAMDGISGPGSIFFFSYVDDRIQREAAKLGDANTVQKIMSMASRVGEPWINFYAQDEIPGFLASCSSFRLESDVSTDVISQKSFPPSRQIAPEKMLVIERYVVAKK